MSEKGVTFANYIKDGVPGSIRYEGGEFINENIRTEIVKSIDDLDSSNVFTLVSSGTDKWNLYNNRTWDILHSNIQGAGELELIECGKNTLLQKIDASNYTYSYTVPNERKYEFSNLRFSDQIICDAETGVFSLYDENTKSFYIVNNSVVEIVPVSLLEHYTRHEIKSDSILIISDDSAFGSDDSVVNKGVRVVVVSRKTGAVVFDRFFQLLDNGDNVKLHAGGEHLLINSGSERQYGFTEGEDDDGIVDFFSLRFKGNLVVRLYDNMEIAMPVNDFRHIQPESDSGVADNYYVDECTVLSLMYDNRIVRWRHKIDCMN